MSTEVQNENMQKVAGTEQDDLIESNEQFDFSQYSIHPLIADYPLMKEQEMLDLQENIRVNGLIDPIIITEKNEIIDGRNRYEACHVTKQSPHFTTENIS